MKFSLLLLIAAFALTGRADETDPAEVPEAPVSDIPTPPSSEHEHATTQPVAKVEEKP